MPINVTVSWMIITKIMYISDEQHAKNHKFNFPTGQNLCSRGSKPTCSWVETYVLLVMKQCCLSGNAIKKVFHYVANDSKLPSERPFAV